MSGILGILHLDGAPVAPRLLQQMNDWHAFRGPDAQQTWVDGHIGFGHTLLNTQEAARHERQPFSLDGAVWIVADARVDRRNDLIAKLQSHGQGDLPAATDIELILRAYQVWGENCVQHLLGDFTFGIWDGPRQRLFCARDQIGIKPLYYAHLGALVVFSNTLDCVRQHPGVSDRLNDLAVADFLVLEMNQDPATTTFADIQRLPPAHSATWSRNGLRLNHYWTMPVDEPLLYRNPDDYVDRFKELLRQSVGDRLRGARTGLFLSGGLDSPTLAATARDLLQERTGSGAPVGLTRVDPLESAEREYATLVASRLGIPINYFTWGNESIDPNWEQTAIYTPEPVPNISTMKTCRDYWRKAESLGQVFLYGEGPDNALRFEWQRYVAFLVREKRYGRLAQDLFRSLLARRQLPFWDRARGTMRKWRTKETAMPSQFPAWINRGLEARLRLHARWKAGWEESPDPSAHPLRPEAYASFHSVLWQRLFEELDPGRTLVHVEVRHPYLDLQVLRFLLAVPSMPWCRAKYLLRRGMKGALPVPVLRRRKGGASCAALVKRLAGDRETTLEPEQELHRYVDIATASAFSSEDPWDMGANLRLRSLNHWLRHSWKQRGAVAPGGAEARAGKGVESADICLHSRY